MIRLIQTAGLSPYVPVAPAFAMVPAILGIWAMRLARTTLPGTTRLFLGLIGIFGYYSGPGWSLARLCLSALQSYRTSGASLRSHSRSNR